MKTIIFLSVLAMLASCSKPSSSRSKIAGTGPDTQTFPNHPTEPGVLPVDNDQDQTQDQSQTNGGTELTTRYVGDNIVLIPGGSNLGTITIRGEDADFLYRKLRIKAVKTGEGKSKDMARVGKHVECSNNSECSININYKNADVIEKENQGKKSKKLVLRSKGYTGTNLVVHGRARKAIITITGKDAKNLYKLIKLGSVNVSEEGKVLEVKTGRSEAPLKCQIEKAEVAKDDIYSCSVTLNSGTGAVLVEEDKNEEE